MFIRALCSPMLLSAFSHLNLIHLALNMYVLYSFGGAIIDRFLGPNQFAAFYLTSAAVSSFTSILHKCITRSPIRALGASGAILALLIYTCALVPGSRLQFVFLPTFDFSAQSAIIALILFDLAGILFKFRLFDHAAHLGGSLFGLYVFFLHTKFIHTSENFLH
ncbi:unnamed protein product [Dracunculus medinensis]|uniref:rhomboid protease n=1 Tax=Dracunculus medinensis TaxID=318479 RepID=A0A0N4UIJ8_DRAME|nr:unnamed protein product [Dracunculus medinensis]